MNIDKSIDLFQRSTEIYFPAGSIPRCAPFAPLAGSRCSSSAAGAYLYDVDGNRYIDYVLSWGPLITGHAHPNVVKAHSTRRRSREHYGAPSPLEIELAK